MTDPVVELKSGYARGIVEKHEEGFEYYSFKGVPYAEPPIGKLRFKDPIPKKSWDGVIDCKNDGPSCLQYDFFFKITSLAEDCLYLNVYTQSINKPNENKPVIVFIHPGAYIFGTANSSYYGPDYLIRKDIVLVMPNYRVGVLGFLDLEDEVAPGNQGLKDLALVLEWVQQNIRKFGGDPGNVTACGTGGTGATAHYLALSPLTKGLIHKVISTCSIVHHPWVAIVNPKSHAIKLCSLLGKDLTSSKDILDFLTSVDAESLLDATERLRRSLECLHFGPGVDSKSPNPFMPVHRYEAADRGLHLPCLVGCNAHESLVILAEDYFKMCDVDSGLLLNFNSKETLSRYNLTENQLRRLYYKNKMVSENLDTFLQFANEIHFFEGIHRFAKVQAEQSSAASYFYQYCYNNPNPISKYVINKLDPRLKPGSGHLEELPFLFKMRIVESMGFPCLERGTKNYKIMEQLTEMWANFARCGKPTIAISELTPVHWLPNINGTVLRYLNIDDDLTMQVCLNLDQKLLAAKNIKD